MIMMVVKVPPPPPSPLSSAATGAVVGGAVVAGSVVGGGSLVGGVVLRSASWIPVSEPPGSTFCVIELPSYPSALARRPIVPPAMSSPWNENWPLSLVVRVNSAP